MDGVYAGAGQCYTCHRGGLSAKGEAANLDAIASLPSVFQGAFSLSDVDENAKAKCARCHYGYANYAIDSKRVGASKTSDFPHSSEGDIKLLGGFTLTGDKPYEQNAVSATEGTDFTYSEDDLRKISCGRCHVVRDAQDYEGTGVQFIRSYHVLDHLFDGWLFDLNLDGTLFSPGANR
jgi:hypothetical protein